MGFNFGFTNSGPQDITFGDSPDGTVGGQNNSGGWANVIGTIGKVFGQVWQTVNPPQVGQINPATGYPYGYNPQTGMMFGQGLNLSSTGMLLLGGIAILAIALFSGAFKR